MKSVVLQKFDFKKVITEIKKSCYEIIYNTKAHPETNNVDLNQVSEMLTRIVSQSLPNIEFRIENELDICCAEMSDPMMGFLLYIAVMFVWKFVVESMTQKHQREFLVLTKKHEDYKKIFFDTCINKKNLHIHYVIAIDESGSMTSHNRFGIAMEGVQDFINYLRKHINDTMCYITLILFDHRCRVIHSGVLLKKFPRIKVTQRIGGTNFSKVLGKCIESINTHKNKVKLNRILFYTDGFARYPSNQINTLNEMITQQGFNLRLHYLTVDAFDRSNRNNVFDKSQSVLGKNCTIDMEVESENLTEKFIEIFELD
jgi:hypothetical protein